ncbi:SDR family oxidoreductase [Pseudodesulfovibrio sp.]|nr:SDR family oxidoreductase [Pseudodesulfovibrio sp.]
MPNQKNGTICVLGATGYVGGRLVKVLLNMGWKVRAAGRSRAKLKQRPYAAQQQCELVEADLFETESLRQALDGCHAAFYLVHSMDGKDDFAAKDRLAAKNMILAAADAGLDRIIYLGGLIPDDPDISHHLKSRAEVGEILSSGSVPCTIFRAGVILGTGSASFEILRYLVDRLPAMVTPKWVRTESQPISIRDVLFYLSNCLDCPETIGEGFDIGGPHIETYERLFRIYQEEAGLPKRLIIPVPLLTPQLSSHWLGLVSPVPVSLARPLILGLKNRVVCRDVRIRSILPRELTDARTAIKFALEKVEQHMAPPCESDLEIARRPEWLECGDTRYSGGTVFTSSYELKTDCNKESLWKKLTNIGGEVGWYCCDSLWSLRGFLDRLIGGVGMRKGRTHAKTLKVGGAIDFWRILDVREPKRLLLKAEMHLPGDALLEFDLGQDEAGKTILRMDSIFFPKGLAGLLYWYTLLPLHNMVFSRMAKAIVQSANCSIVSDHSR